MQMRSYLESATPPHLVIVFSSFRAVQFFIFSHVSNLMYSFSLSQVVPSYTHVKHNEETSLIDLALLSTLTKDYSCKTISPLGNSDHTGIALLVETGRETINRQSGSRKVWQYIYADFGRAND